MRAAPHAPARPPRLRLWPSLALLALVLLALPSASCSTSSAGPGSNASPSSSRSAGPSAGSTAQVTVPVDWPSADWKHVAVALGYLRQDQSKAPVVCLLGGSAARECTVSDVDWRDEIAAMGGGDVLAFNLGATNQSYDDNIGMVRNMPKGPKLMLIGINLGRYTRSPKKPYKPPAVPADLTLDQVDDYQQHRFDEHHIGSDERKIERLTEYWYGQRQPYFDENFAYNAQRLRDLIALCDQRGFDVALVNLPLNLATVAGRLDEPRTRYRQDCLAVADQYDVPYVDFVADIPFISRDFADNWHLVPTGRVKWQHELSRVTAGWLKRYGMAPSASPASNE